MDTKKIAMEKSRRFQKEEITLTGQIAKKKRALNSQLNCGTSLRVKCRNGQRMKEGNM
jgi:hypothetical protein